MHACWSRSSMIASMYEWTMDFKQWVSMFLLNVQDETSKKMGHEHRNSALWRAYLQLFSPHLQF